MSYETELAEWKAKHGISEIAESNPDEMRMTAEERISTKNAWCLGCDKLMPVREMKLITRRIDPYVQIEDGPSDYIHRSNRVRMCPACFKSEHEDDEDDGCCERCNGEGQILICIDDMCRGAGECMHGDGYAQCPNCKGQG